jgi:glycosyltransferase involved in cell wall biosynthesis
LWLGAADIVVTPYPDLEQMVSGTLAHAMGAGKAIVSTPYAYASEMLANGRGRLVAAGSKDALAEGLIELAHSSELRAEYGRKAYAHTRNMLWPKVGAAYREIFARVGRDVQVEEPAALTKKVATARA